MALDLHKDVLVVGLQLVHQVHQAGLGLGGQLGALVVELDGVVGQHRRVAELALSGRVGRVSPLHGVLGRLVQLGQAGVVLLQSLALLVDLRLRGVGLLIDYGHVLIDVFLGRASSEAERAGRQRQGGYRRF